MIFMPTAHRQSATAMRLAAAISMRSKGGGNKNKPKTDNSFEFTGYCADAGNQVPNDLVDFTAKYNPQNKMFRVSKTNVSLSERRSQTCLDYAERKKRR